MDKPNEPTSRVIVVAAALLAAVTLLPSAAQAREVHACRAADGARSYQDTPCAEGTAGSQTLTLPEHPADEPRRQARRAEQAAREYAEQDRLRIAAFEATAKAELPRSLGGIGDIPAPAREARKRPGRPMPKLKPPPGEAACSAALSKRELAYQARGNRMNFDARRRLLDTVIDRCGLER